MRHRIVMALFALGAIGGFASGFRSLHCARERREAFERHVARVCVDAARDTRDANDERGAGAPR